MTRALKEGEKARDGRPLLYWVIIALLAVVAAAIMSFYGGPGISDSGDWGWAPGGRWREPADSEGGGSSGWPWVVWSGCMREPD